MDSSSGWLSHCAEAVGAPSAVQALAAVAGGPPVPEVVYVDADVLVHDLAIRVSCLDRLQTEVEPESFVEVGHDWRRDGADPWSKTMDGHRSDLLGLGLRVLLQAGLCCWEQHLEGVDAGDA